MKYFDKLNSDKGFKNSATVCHGDSHDIAQSKNCHHMSGSISDNLESFYRNCNKS